ncbi:MAG TPA: GGDEF domain-containing protein [Azospirillaceae bacterium]|nr:GGDEF domain-containing protein [Azospirillaceae bacterium]
MGSYADPLPAQRVWTGITSKLRHAFQPIVQMRTGACVGYEALLRGWENAGFSGPMDLFDAAHEGGALGEVESVLMTKAVEAFGTLAAGTDLRLFLNVDARLSGAAVLVSALAKDRPFRIVHEISERDTSAAGRRLEAAVSLYRRNGVGIALDDFGVGFGGMRLLYEAAPDFVKIDRFFIDGIERDRRKQAIVGYLVQYAHTLGISIIAEGIETPAEFYVCRDLGCDLAQGYLLGRPEFYEGGLALRNPDVERLNGEDRRRPPASRERLSALIERTEPLPADAPKSVLLELFANPSTPSVVPVVDREGRPVGVVRERDLKPFVYSRYGADLLRNKVAGHTLAALLAPCPACDIDTPVERVVEAFSEEGAADGILIVEGGRYVGFLRSQSLLRLVHEQRLAAATDQNPLTRLPGNIAISAQADALLAEPERARFVAYFDFDQFKPFNDRFGFRQGDRAILMFADRLKALAAQLGAFAGHVGGDDFVLAGRLDPARAEAEVARLLDLFRSDAESLYEPETRERGWFEGRDREGVVRRIGLLRASAVLILLPPDAGRGTTVEALVDTITRLKPEAKRDPKGLRPVTLA